MKFIFFILYIFKAFANLTEVSSLPHSSVIENNKNDFFQSNKAIDADQIEIRLKKLETLSYADIEWLYDYAKNKSPDEYTRNRILRNLYLKHDSNIVLQTFLSSKQDEIIKDACEILKQKKMEVENTINREDTQGVDQFDFPKEFYLKNKLSNIDIAETDFLAIKEKFYCDDGSSFFEGLDNLREKLYASINDEVSISSENRNLYDSLEGDKINSNEIEDIINDKNLNLVDEFISNKSKCTYLIDDLFDLKDFPCDISQIIKAMSKNTNTLLKDLEIHQKEIKRLNDVTDNSVPETQSKETVSEVFKDKELDNSFAVYGTSIKTTLKNLSEDCFFISILGMEGDKVYGKIIIETPQNSYTFIVTKRFLIDATKNGLIDLIEKNSNRYSYIIN
ncbi:MAG: hypothetical protein H6622_08560 [Halobacteriovoraceae bacterium]|nr:hypothetical protein [Halobacteriovoraceae bacterium]